MICWKGSGHQYDLSEGDYDLSEGARTRVCFIGGGL